LVYGDYLLKAANLAKAERHLFSTAELQNKELHNIEVKNPVLFLSKTSAVRYSLFDIRHSTQAEAVRLKREGFQSGARKNRRHK